MPYPGLLCPEPLPLWQATADPYLLRRHPKTVQSQSLWGLCSFLLGPDAHKVLFVPSQSLFPQSGLSSLGSVVGLIVTSSKGLMPYPGLLCPEPLPLWQATADLYFCRIHSNTVLSQSL